MHMLIVLAYCYLFVDVIVVLYICVCLIVCLIMSSWIMSLAAYGMTIWEILPLSLHSLDP